MSSHASSENGQQAPEMENSLATGPSPFVRAKSAPQFSTKPAANGEPNLLSTLAWLRKCNKELATLGLEEELEAAVSSSDFEDNITPPTSAQSTNNANTQPASHQSQQPLPAAATNTPLERTLARMSLDIPEPPRPPPPTTIMIRRSDRMSLDIPESQQTPEPTSGANGK